MRILLLALSVLAIFIGADAANAGPSTTARDASAAPADPAASREDANQQTEDRLGLDKRKRRDVQRRLTRLGFDTKSSGKFDEKTRAVIFRWQAARDYPATGFLNAAQHQALVSESAAAAQANAREKSEERPARRRSARQHRGGGGPIAAIGGVVGGVVGGVFGRR